jgi:cytochrome c biogenesis protein
MSKKTPRFSLVLLEFLGSMNLAIMLLCALGISSAIGTMLKQNQPFEDYLLRFGPFWFEVFKELGLYNIYASIWFLAINAFLVVSTLVCVYRNGPGMLREIGSWKDSMQHRSLAGMRHSVKLSFTASNEATRDSTAALLTSAGYQVRAKQQGEAILVSAKKGMFNRLGYILAHLSIGVICLGGAMDSSFQFAIKQWLGEIKIETRNIPASEVPAISWLDEDNWSFRGNVNLPEGSRADLVFLNQGDGYLVQKLPFEVELKDFRIEHYKTGQPKSFESDLIIHDPDLAEPLEKTIAVNHPLIHKGLAIYQASFQDGGSELQLKTWPLHGNAADSIELGLEVFTQETLPLKGESYQLELDDFRLFNINPVLDEQGEQEFKNFGPNFTVRLRNSSGQALEYQTYQLPLEFEGRLFFTSGMRTSPAEPYRFLHIPADENYSLERFMALLSLLHDRERMAKVIARNVQADVAKSGQPEQAQQLTQSMLLLLNQFLQGGYEGIIQEMQQHVPEARREEVFNAYLKVLRSVLGEAFRELYPKEPTAEQWQFYSAAVEAINTLPFYQSPVFFQLKSFQHIQASGLQVTKSPGTFWVYLGSAMLVAGVFMLFYLNRQRLWIWIEGNELLFAGQSHRKTNDFPQEFAKLSAKLEQVVEQGRQSTPESKTS